jgi:SAM-dependent methyltransferase
MSSSAAVRQYWDTHIHDLEISAHAPGTREFFSDLDQYHFEKLHHLPELIQFDRWRDKDVLDVGCGAGVEVVRLAQAGARVTGIDLAPSAAALTLENVQQQRVTAGVLCGDGERLPFRDNSFDLVYAHGVVQYAAVDTAVVAECHRVVRPGGRVIVQVYNRVSWLNLLSKLMKVPLEHDDAPVLRRYSIAELRRLMAPFARVEIIPERFPVKSRLHKGWKGAAFNAGFVGTFNALPRAWVRRFGWHLLADARK